MLVEALLREHRMPPEEIRAILETSDPRIVRRYLELHRERLQERLAEQLRAIDDVAEHLAGLAAERRPSTAFG